MIKKHNNIKTLYNGGKGSGNWGHKGRPGKIGGSGKGGNDPERVKYGARLGALARQVKARNSKMELLEKIKTAKNTSINRKKATETSKEINVSTITDKEMYDNLNMNMSDIYNYHYGDNFGGKEYVKNNISYFNNKIKNYNLEKSFSETDLKEIKTIVQNGKLEATKLSLENNKPITKLSDKEFKKMVKSSELTMFQRAWAVPSEDKMQEYEKQFNEGNRTFVGNGYYGGGFYFSKNLYEKGTIKKPNNTSKKYANTLNKKSPYFMVAYVGVPKDFKFVDAGVLKTISNNIDNDSKSKIDDNISLLAQILGFDGVYCNTSIDDDIWINVLNMGKLYQYGDLKTYKGERWRITR